MDKTSLAFVVIILFSVVGAIGDYFLKLASDSENSYLTKWFAIGLVIYASTAFGWVYVMRTVKLATVGLVYSVSIILLLAAMDVLIFKARPKGLEILGMGMALTSLVLLWRFGGGEGE
jgi:drug/metabolite transporter (DMT)-like permease